MPNTNIKQLYGYILQQMAAESYFEGNELNSIEEIKKQLYLGANREGYKTNNTDLNEGYPGYTRMTKQQADEFLDKFKIVHQWSDNPTPTGKRPLPEGIDGKPKLNAGDLLANTGLSATLIEKVEKVKPPGNTPLPSAPPNSATGAKAVTASATRLEQTLRALPPRALH